MHRLTRSVITCEEAADAKGIPLARELKSLLVSTSQGVLLVHLRGTDRLSLRKLKRTLGLQEAYLAPAKILASMGLGPGCICPLLPSLWELPQVVDQGVLVIGILSTNAGRPDHYVFLSPEDLLAAPKVTTADVADRSGAAIR